MAESKDIVAYLYKTYAMWTPPNELLQSASSIITPLLAPLYKVIAPLQAGSYKENEFEYTSEIAEAKASIYDDIASNPVVLYTYELSPFCMEAKTCLENCGITFKEVSLGLEWIPGLIKDPAKRAALLDMTGQSSLPHIFIGGESIGGLFSGSPGLVPALEKGLLSEVVDDAKKAN
jgi:glutaredoxin 3